MTCTNPGGNTWSAAGPVRAAFEPGFIPAPASPPVPSAGCHAVPPFHPAPSEKKGLINRLL